MDFVSPHSLGPMRTWLSEWAAASLDGEQARRLVLAVNELASNSVCYGGGAGTLRACALVTDVLKSLPVRQCGYAGLMLPVLEDAVLARRAVEGHYGLRDLLLFSSVCGTGLDVVPVPGDTPAAVLENVLLDVAAQSVKLRKPLSARLFLVPGKAAGDPVHFDDPLLTDSIVFRVS
jgi:uncharacterized protein (UPF0210 family)